MANIIIALFCCVGAAVSIFFIVTMTFDFFSRRDSRSRERKEQFTRIISAIERIEANTRKH